ncbi:hypothetical protein [Sideroxydans sp.]
MSYRPSLVFMKCTFLMLISALVCLTYSAEVFASICEEKFSRPSYKTRGFYCTPGQMVRDAYELDREIACEEMEVDHLVSLRQAWDSGVCGDDLKRLANDPRNLRFTYWQTNRAKGYLQPEVFAKTRSDAIARQVTRDAEVIMSEYRIKTKSQLLSDRFLFYATSGSKHIRIPLASINESIRNRLTYRKVGEKTVVYVGKRAVGYAIGVGLAIEAVMAAGWAADWLTSPSQDAQMKKRAEYFRSVLEGEK